MENEMKNRLTEAGTDVESALERFMGNEDMFLRFLKRFPDDANYANLLKAMEIYDQEAALNASHTLKGVCGNLLMTTLFDLLAKQVTAFRNGDWHGAARLMPEIASAYERITQTVKSLE